MEVTQFARRAPSVTGRGRLSRLWPAAALPTIRSTLPARIGVSRSRAR